MELIPTLLLALGVSADAFAVAVAHGGAEHRLRKLEAVKLALLFGIFQAVMPVLGWSLGNNFRDLINSIDHWIAFTLLGGIGLKMIYDDLKGDDGSLDPVDSSKGIWHLLVLALATSIDAFAVGLGLTFLESITRPVLIIGFVTFAFSLAGVFLGHRYKHLGRSKSRMIGGMILIGIGTKILLDHLGLL
ncbi:MAG: manganese efflux pump MntP family protein [Acidobacteriota bacterium]